MPEVDIQAQNDQGVLGSLDPSILDMGLACWGSKAILVQVSKNDDEDCCSSKKINKQNLEEINWRIGENNFEKRSHEWVS